MNPPRLYVARNAVTVGEPKIRCTGQSARGDWCSFPEESPRPSKLQARLENTTNLTTVPSILCQSPAFRGAWCYFLRGSESARSADAASEGRNRKISSRSKHPSSPRSIKPGQIFISRVRARSRRDRDAASLIREPSPLVEGKMRK